MYSSNIGLEPSAFALLIMIIFTCGLIIIFQVSKFWETGVTEEKSVTFCDLSTLGLTIGTADYESQSECYQIELQGLYPVCVYTFASEKLAFSPYITAQVQQFTVQTLANPI